MKLSFFVLDIKASFELEKGKEKDKLKKRKEQAHNKDSLSKFMSMLSMLKAEMPAEWHQWCQEPVTAFQDNIVVCLSSSDGFPCGSTVGYYGKQ